MGQKKKALGRIPHSLSWLEPHNDDTDVSRDDQQDSHKDQKDTKTWTRATFIIDRDLHEIVKAYAYWQRVTVKEVVDAALTQYFADKQVDPMPRKTRNRLLE